MNRVLLNMYHGLSIDRLFALICIGPFKNKLNNAVRDFVKNDQVRAKEIRFDIRKSYARYRVNPFEYFLFGFDNNKDVSYRKSFVSDKVKDLVCLKVSGHNKFANELADKWKFYKLTSHYFNRDAMLLDKNTKKETFVDFALRNQSIFAKPLNASKGEGALAFEISNEAEASKAFDKMREGRYIVEKRIMQHPEMARWNESSVNTVRVPAFLNKEGFHLLPPFFRIGRKGAIVDNAGAGGVYANINPETGVIYTKGFDEHGNYYDVHPDTGLKFEGYQMPQWKELINLVEEVHRKCMPSHIYIGWDFALTENGWVLIEGNWGQLVNQYVDKVGLKVQFMEYMKGGAVIQ